MVALTNAKVFDGRKMLDGTHTVTVEGNRIIAVGEPLQEPRDIVDVAGMTVMPGMISCHLHADFFKANFGDPVGTEFPPGVLMAMGVRTCRVLLESGFTGYLGASAGHHLDAQLKIAIAEDIMIGPRIRACGHHINTSGSIMDFNWWKKRQNPGVDLFADGPDELRRLVRQEIAHGAEIIKIFAGEGHGIPNRTTRNMSRDEIAAIVNAAHERAVMVRAHVATKDMILECIELGVDIIDHGDGVDEECIDAMVAAGTSWVPSLLYLEGLLQLGMAPRVGVTAETRDHVHKTLPLAQEAGVRILIGDDYSGIFRGMLPDEDNPLDHQVGNYAREFAYYAALEGLTPAEVLSWGTANAGELLVDAPQKVGVIEPGALADIIVVDGDPLADLTLLARPQETLKAVMRDGAMVIDRLPARSAQPIG